MTGIDAEFDAHADPQLRLAGRIDDADPHRDALHHLDPVAAAAFSAGSSEKLDADAGLILSTVPFQTCPG